MYSSLFHLYTCMYVNVSLKYSPDDNSANTGENVTQNKLPGVQAASDTELQRLRDLLKQRDDEINILLKMLKQEKRRALEAEVALKDAGVNNWKRSSSPILGRTSPMQSEGGSSVPSTASRSVAESPQSVSVSSVVSPSASGRGERVRADDYKGAANRGSEQLRAKLKAGLL